MPTANIQHCPICGSEAFEAYVIDQASIFRCPVCTHRYSIFSGPRMDKAIYSDAYYTETHVNWFNNPDLKLYERIVRYMSENSPSKSLIDVGCGNGNFVNFVDNSNSIDVVRIVGIDLAAIPTRGKIEMINGDIYQHNFNEKFDYVVTLAVIEHVSDVKRFVERLMSLCADNGHIVIMTVNEAGLLYSIAKILFYLGMRTPLRRLYDAHHIHHFTSSSLDELINRTPGLVIKEKCYHNIPMRSVDLPYKSRFMVPSNLEWVGLESEQCDTRNLGVYH